ncbi:hypothetical protein [Alistipes sp.]|uniref:hypothetical protein n=1 Tax=Alistipes sp. TaxID=1872444 RepID=UPI003AF18FFB
MNSKILPFLCLLCCVQQGCTDEPDGAGGGVPPTTGFGNRITELTATLPNAGSDTECVWLVGDAVTVTDGIRSARFGASAGIGTATGKFNGSLACEAGPLYAVYPPVGDLNGFVAPITIGTAQHAGTRLANDIRVGRCDEALFPAGSHFQFERKAVEVHLTLDFAAPDDPYAAERIASVKITADGVNIAGECACDLRTPDAALTGSVNSITYTFPEAPALARPVEAVALLAPCDLTRAASVHYLVTTDRYSFLFSQRPEEAFAAGQTVRVALAIGEFSPTDAETPAEGEVRIRRELPALDLSARGTANCYIVDREARCSFDATVMGNGAAGILAAGGFTDYLGNPLAESAAIEPVSAALLWQTADGLISEPVLSNGLVTFTSSGKRGNALVAVFDAEGRIMWSWHIWCTDTPAELSCMPNKAGNAYTFLDRNLGATAADDDPGLALEKDPAPTLGLHYQWGRKDPLPGAACYNSMAEPALYGPVDKVAVEAPTAATTIGYAIQHPATFFKAADWLQAGRNDALWGNPDGEGSTPAAVRKSIYDPCPPGYKVPPRDAFTLFTTTGENTKLPAEHNIRFAESAKRGWHLYYTATGSGAAAWYPSNGCRYYSTGALNRGSFYYYWTSAPSAGTKACCLAVKNDAKEVDPLYTFQRGNAQTTRCVKE